LFSEALTEEGAVVFAKACELGLEGIVSNGGQPLQELAEPSLAQNQEPRFRQDVTQMPRDGSLILGRARADAHHPL
jgi:hypothetical protein